ncbi:hypothetical protein KIPB_006844, partial [Kipferlia bialata]|eukprot:g6844.t1
MSELGSYGFTTMERDVLELNNSFSQLTRHVLMIKQAQAARSASLDSIRVMIEEVSLSDSPQAMERIAVCEQRLQNMTSTLTALRRSTASVATQ